MRTLKRSEVVVETNPFDPLSKEEERAVQTAIEAYGAFVRRKVVRT